MNDLKRERIYWLLTVYFLLCSLIPLYRLSIHPAVPTFSQGLFLAALVGSMPLTLAVNLCIAMLFGPTAKRRFWIVRPGSSQEAESGQTPEACFDLVTQRLTQLGFKYHEDPPAAGAARNLRFTKGQANPLNCFLDHAFNGSITISPSEYRDATHIRAQVVFEDTLIQETGEQGRLDELSRYFSLRTKTVDLRSLLFTLGSGLILAFSTTVVGFLACTTRVVDAAWCYTLGPATLGMLFFAWLGIKKSAGFAIGKRLVFGGFYLGAAPFLSYLFSLLLAR
jgi:hypothetical protein